MKRKLKEKRENNNRLNFIIAIIFLIGAAVLIKMYCLQIKDYDLYCALAANQHTISGILEPERGKIFIQDNPQGDSSQLFSLATNKNFALVYAVPRDLKEGEAESMAEKLYKVFHQASIEQEVDTIMAEAGGLEENFKPIKREAEINIRKEVVIKNYLDILMKKGDPYEPLNKKADEDALKKLYAALTEVAPEELEIEYNKIYKVGEGEKKEAIVKGLGFSMEKYRYYPENKIGSHLLGFVGYNEDKKEGKYGLEGFFNAELSGKAGLIKAERSERGDIIIINDRQYNKPENGKDLILTINRPIEFFACKKLEESVLKHGAAGGSVIVMDPYSGAILAVCSFPDYNPNNYAAEKDLTVFNNPAIFDQYEPGSIFKPITMAAALDKGKVTPDTKYDDKGFIIIEGWSKPIKNSDFEVYGGHGLTDMTAVLVNSLNTGAIYAMQQVGAPIFAEYVKNFGFGEKTGIELETESHGDIANLIKKEIRPVEAATATFGQGITATPLQMVNGYSAIANGGILMKPYLVREITGTDGLKIITKPQQIRRVISEKTALLLSAMLVNVVDQGHAKKAAVSGYFIAGKTGTAQVAEKGGYGSDTDHSFVGFGPVDNPKFAMITKLDRPKSARFAESTAAPLFKEIAEFILQYYQVEKER